MGSIKIRVERANWIEEWPIGQVKRVYLSKERRYCIELNDYYGKEELLEYYSAEELEGKINGETLDVIYACRPSVVDKECIKHRQVVKIMKKLIPRL